jgi:hypothetical protein
LKTAVSQTAIRDAGADNIVLLLQGCLVAGDMIAAAGPQRQPKLRPKAHDLTPPETTMGRFQQGVANERRS